MGRFAAPLAWLLLAGGCADGDDEPPPPPGGEAGADAPHGAGEEGEGEAEEAERVLPGPPEDFEPEPPALPAPPELGTPDCPEGWTPEAQAPPGSVAGPCVPPEPVDCPAGWAQFASDAECVRLGTPCPEGGERFPPEAVIRDLAREADDPDVAIWYVDPEAPAGGAGTRDSPSHRIFDAPQYPIVALGPGEWEFVQALTQTSVVGACVGGTVIIGEGRHPGVSVGPKRDMVVANLTIRGGRTGLVTGGLESGLTVRAVEVLDSIHTGVAAAGLGRTTLDSVRVRGVVSEDPLVPAFGVSALDGHKAVLRRVAIEGVEGRAVVGPLVDGARVRLELADVRISRPARPEQRALQAGLGNELHAERLVIRGGFRSGVVLPDEAGFEPWTASLDVVSLGPFEHPFGVGLAADAGHLTVSRLGVTGMSQAGIVITGEEGMGGNHMEDVRVTEGLPRNPEGFAAGIAITNSEATLERTALRDIRNLALQIRGKTRAEVRDLVIENVHGRIRAGGLQRQGGVGIALPSGGTARVERVLIRSVEGRAVGMWGDQVRADGRLDLVDAELANVQAAEVHTSVVRALNDSDLRLERVLIRDSEGLGLSCTSSVGDPPRLQVRDLTVRQMRATLGTESTAAMSVAGGCELDARRVRFHDNEMAGLVMSRTPDSPAPRATVEDLAVLDTASAPWDGALGWGVTVGFGSELTLRRALLRGNRLIGLATQGWGGSPETRVTAERLVILDTGEEECALLPEDDVHRCGAGFESYGLGQGVSVVDGTRMELSDFFVAGSAHAGLRVDEDSVLTAAEGTAARNVFGLMLPALGRDEALDRLDDRVFLVDNDIDVPLGEGQARKPPSPPRFDDIDLDDTFE